MPIHSFFKANSEAEAIGFLKSGDGDGTFIAGGTDLLCADDFPDFVIDVRGFLDYRKFEGNEFIVGAATSVTAVAEWDELAKADDRLLRACAYDFASRQMRNMATVGGNLASAVPSADLAPPLIALDARCIIAGANGRREVSVEDLFVAPHRSCLENELLVEVRIPSPAKSARTHWFKVCRIPGDIATASVAVVFVPGIGDECADVRIACGAVAPRPVRARAAEDALRGRAATAEAITAAASLVGKEISPIDDHRSSAAYRRHVTEVLVRRALLACAGLGE